MSDYRAVVLDVGYNLGKHKLKLIPLIDSLLLEGYTIRVPMYGANKSVIEYINGVNKEMNNAIDTNLEIFSIADLLNERYMTNMLDTDIEVDSCHKIYRKGKFPLNKINNFTLDERASFYRMKTKDLFKEYFNTHYIHKSRISKLNTTMDILSVENGYVEKVILFKLDDVTNKRRERVGRDITVLLKFSNLLDIASDVYDIEKVKFD